MQVQTGTLESKKLTRKEKKAKKRLAKVKALLEKNDLGEKFKSMDVDGFADHLITQFNIPSINYLSPKLYKFFIGLLMDQRLKMQLLGRLCGKNNVVLDLPCGMGDLITVLDESNIYHGWDLNPNYLSFCKKKFCSDENGAKKRVHLDLVNIFHDHRYPESDVIMLCDILHHVYPNHRELMQKVMGRAKSRIILCEPMSVNMANMRLNSQIVEWFFKHWFGKWPKWIIKFFDLIMGDFDGINGFTKMEEWNFEEPEFLKMYKSFESNGFVLTRLYGVSDSIIGVYEKGDQFPPTREIPEVKWFQGDEFWLIRMGVGRVRIPSKNGRKYK